MNLIFPSKIVHLHHITQTKRSKGQSGMGEARQEYADQVCASKVCCVQRRASLQYPSETIRTNFGIYVLLLFTSSIYVLARIQNRKSKSSIPWRPNLRWPYFWNRACLHCFKRPLRKILVIKIFSNLM